MKTGKVLKHFQKMLHVC